MKNTVFSALVGGLVLAVAAATAACTAPAEVDDLPGKKSDDATAKTDKDGNDPSRSRDSAGGQGTSTGIPCEVEKVLKARCQSCHKASPEYGASTSLMTFADLMKPGPGAQSGKKVLDLVAARIHDTNRPMPPTPSPVLNADEMKVVDGWIKDGAKQSAAVCDNGGPVSNAPEKLDCSTGKLSTLKAAKPYEMKQGVLDQYVCVGVDVDASEKRHVIGFSPKVDNSKILHHILLFESKEALSPEPTECGAFGAAQWKMISGWAPGGKNLIAPPEAGFPQEKGTTHYVLQFHYNNAQNLAGEKDLSGYELCTTDKLRPNDASVLAFGSINFELPPRAETTVKCEYKVLDPRFKDVKLFSATPHMHTNGTSMSTEVTPRGGGAPMSVIDKKFDFQNQVSYPVSAGLNLGDTVTTRCGFKNPSDQTIKFGEGTGDEMCFNFMAYYPAIPDIVVGGLPVFTWISPSTFTSCTTE